MEGRVTTNLYKFVGILSLLAFAFISIFLFTLLANYSNLAKAESSAGASSDFTVTVDEVIAIDISSPCGNPNPLIKEINLDISPRSTGTMSSCPNVVTVDTNTPGFQLLFKASSANLVNTDNSSLTIPSTSNSSPNTLAVNTWGYAIPKLDAANHSVAGIPLEVTSVFDDSYSQRNNSNPIPSDKFAKTPTADAVIKQIEDNDTTITNNQTSVYYGATADMGTASGTYRASVVYTAISQEVIPIQTYCGTPDFECIVFTVDVGTTGTYSIPTSGYLNATGHTYNWDVYVDGVLKDTYSGTGSTASTGIVLTGLTNGEHQIKILPNGNNPKTTPSSLPGWGNAFGHYSNTNGANIATNKQKLISLDQPLTTMAFSPKTTESTTNASRMFGNTFYDCTNLTTSAVIIDTYKLPHTITNLAGFLNSTHRGNETLTEPVDLTSLVNWLSSNVSILDIAGFLGSTHYDNTSLTTPIDLASLSGWLNHNTSITDLSTFLGDTHYNNPALKSSIDLTPLKNWFKYNTSVTNLNNFLHSTHYNNTTLDTSINLVPLVDWFNADTPITSLRYFLNYTHYNNTALTTPIDLTPLKDWFNANNRISYPLNFLHRTHYNNTALTTPINLTPLKDWFNANSSIIDLSNFLGEIHYNNTALTTPINLAPLANWFSNNTSITHLFGFLYRTHYNNTTLTTPIDLTPLKDWFSDDHSVANLAYFLFGTHSGNTSLTLSSQTILPDWIKTINQAGTNVWNVDATFMETFFVSSAKANDSGEIKFIDGTVLSSIGQPNSNKQTYYNRSGIRAKNLNWGAEVE